MKGGAGPEQNIAASKGRIRNRLGVTRADSRPACRAHPRAQYPHLVWVRPTFFVRRLRDKPTNQGNRYNDCFRCRIGEQGVGAYFRTAARRMTQKLRCAQPQAVPRIPQALNYDESRSWCRLLLNGDGIGESRTYPCHQVLCEPLPTCRAVHPMRQRNDQWEADAVDSVHPVC